MIDSLEILKRRREYIVEQIRTLNEQIKLLEEERDDILVAENTVKAEREICKCKKCCGTGVIKHPIEGGTHRETCKECNGDGYTKGTLKYIGE